MIRDHATLDVWRCEVRRQLAAARDQIVASYHLLGESRRAIRRSRLLLGAPHTTPGTNPSQHRARRPPT